MAKLRRKEAEDLVRQRGLRGLAGPVKLDASDIDDKDDSDDEQEEDPSAAAMEQTAKASAGSNAGPNHRRRSRSRGSRGKRQSKGQDARTDPSQRANASASSLGSFDPQDLADDNPRYESTLLASSAANTAAMSASSPVAAVPSLMSEIDQGQHMVIDSFWT